MVLQKKKKKNTTEPHKPNQDLHIFKYKIWSDVSESKCDFVASAPSKHDDYRIGLDGDRFYLSQPPWVHTGTSTEPQFRSVNWPFTVPLQVNPCNARFGRSTCHPSLDFWYYHLSSRYPCGPGKLSSTKWWFSRWLYLRNPYSPTAHRSTRLLRWTSQDLAIQNFAVQFEAGLGA